MADIRYNRECRNLLKSAVYELFDTMSVGYMKSDFEIVPMTNVIHVSPNPSYIYVELTASKERDIKRCPKNNNHTVSETVSIEVDIFGDRDAKLGQFLSGESFVVTEDLLKLLIENNVTGFRPVPVKVKVIQWSPAGGLPNLNLWYLDVTGCGGTRDRFLRNDGSALWPVLCPSCKKSLICSGCGEKETYQCQSCGLCPIFNFPDSEDNIKVLHEPQIIDKKDWDGTDIFRLKKDPSTFITKRFLDILLSNEVENFVYRPAGLCLDP